MSLIQKQESQAQEGEGIPQESQLEAVGLGSEARVAAWLESHCTILPLAFSHRECQSSQFYGTQNDIPKVDQKHSGADLRRDPKLGRTGRLG